MNTGKLNSPTVNTIFFYFSLFVFLFFLFLLNILSTAHSARDAKCEFSRQKSFRSECTHDAILAFALYFSRGEKYIGLYLFCLKICISF